MTDRLGAQFPLGSDRHRSARVSPDGVLTSDEMARHSLEASQSKKKRLVIGTLYGVGIVVALLLGWLIYARTSPAKPLSAEVTTYSHTGVFDARGIAAQGHYVWIADVGKLPQGAAGVNHGEKVVRLDVATGVATPITSSLFSLPLGIATSPHFVWVLNQGFSTHQYSILRIDDATLAVTNVTLPPRLRYGFNYSQGGYVMAGGSLWISTTEGVVRVNTTTLAVSLITSPLLTGGPIGAGMVADARYVWLSQPAGAESNPAAQAQYVVRVAIATGVVTKFSVPDVLQATPVADEDGILWIVGTQGLQRFNLRTRRASAIILPENVALLDTPSGLAVVSKGYLNLVAEGALVRVNLKTGHVAVEFSTTLESPGGVTATNGAVWVDNTFASQSHLPVLVRVP